MPSRSVPGCCASLRISWVMQLPAPDALADTHGPGRTYSRRVDGSMAQPGAFLQPGTQRTAESGAAGGPWLHSLRRAEHPPVGDGASIANSPARHAGSGHGHGDQRSRPPPKAGRPRYMHSGDVLSARRPAGKFLPKVADVDFEPPSKAHAMTPSAPAPGANKADRDSFSIDIKWRFACRITHLSQRIDPRPSWCGFEQGGSSDCSLEVRAHDQVRQRRI